MSQYTLYRGIILDDICHFDILILMFVYASHISQVADSLKPVACESLSSADNHLIFIIAGQPIALGYMQYPVKP